MRNPGVTLGPQPLPDLPALHGVRLRVLGELTRRSRPLDTATLTSRLGGHPNTIRGPLEVLTEAGLASRDPLPTSGRGRPALGSAVTPAGRTASRMCRAGGPVGAADVAEALVSFLAGRPDGAIQAREFGRHWGAGLATPADPARTRVDGQPWWPLDAAGRHLAVTVDRVVATLERMGFSPEISAPTDNATHTEADDGDADATPVIRLVTCPLLEAARAHPAVVCGIHHGLVEGLAHDSTRGGLSAGLTPDSTSGGTDDSAGSIDDSARDASEGLSIDSAGDPAERSHHVALLPFAEPGACLLTISANGLA